MRRLRGPSTIRSMLRKGAIFGRPFGVNLNVIQPMNGMQQPVRPPTSGLSIASLVLGILSICGGVTALPAIICGHIGLSRIKKSGGQLQGTGLAITGLVIGYLALIGAVVVAFIFVGAKKAVEKAEVARVEAEEASYTPFDFGAFVAPEMPERPQFSKLGESGVQVASVTLNTGGEPGDGMTMWIYLPSGEAAAGSLKCVLTAPAGTNLLSGAGLGELDDESYHDESLPYAEAGMAVLRFSIDGEIEDEDDEEQIEVAYKAFRDANAGVTNAKLALEYVLERLPEVNPEQIFSAGDSSAGSLSLLFGEHEPRLAGSLAYAPAVNIEDHFSELLENPFASLLYPGIKNFARRSSPMTHVESLDVPVFLFHAEDDMMAPIEETREFVSQLKASGNDVSFEEIEGGDHYGSMIETGIPKGIEWIKAR